MTRRFVLLLFLCFRFRIRRGRRLGCSCCICLGIFGLMSIGVFGVGRIFCGAIPLNRLVFLKLRILLEVLPLGISGLQIEFGFL